MRPGVYLFRDAKERVLYVGKAKSIKKRVASHFSNPATRGFADLRSHIESIEYVVTETEAEALLLEQEFIKRYKPRFNIRLRDDKSYPYVAISLDEKFPRVYFTRERHRRERAYFGPYSSAKKMRETLDLLQKIFLFRSCDGPRAGPSLGLAVPRLLHQALRGALRRLRRGGGVPRDDRRGRRLPVSGKYRQIERQLEARMKAASDEQRFEQAALERNRLQVGARAARAPADLQRVGRVRSTRSRSPPRGPTRTRRCSRSATACSPTARASTCSTRRGARTPRSPRSSSSSTTASAMAIPPQIMVQRGVGEATSLAEALAERRGGPVEVRTRRARRQAAHPRARRAQRAARARPGAAQGRAPAPAARRGARRPAARAAARQHPDADRVLRHLEPDGHEQRRLDGRVRGRRAEEVRLPALPHPRRRGRRRLRVDVGGPLAAHQRSGSASATSHRTTATTTRASRRCPTSS